MTKFLFSLVFFSSFFASLASADPLEQLRIALQYSDTVIDGSSVDRVRKCAYQSGLDIITQGGLYSNWQSRTEGVTVFDDRRNQRLVVTAEIACHQKQQKKAGCGGYVEETEWFDYRGDVTLYVGVQGGFYAPGYFIKGSRISAPSICGTALTAALEEVIKGLSPDL